MLRKLYMKIKLSNHDGGRNMDILCLFGLFPNEYRDEIVSNSRKGTQNAADVLQWSLVYGLDENLTTPVSICNAMYVGSFPLKYRKWRIPSFVFHHTNDANDINIGFCNIMFLKYLFRYRAVKKQIMKWCREGDNNKAIIAYAMTDSFVRLLRYVKKLNPNITTCLVVPDLPEYMNVTASNKWTYKKFKKLQIERIKNNLIYVDSYVLLTEQMKDWFDGDLKYSVVEGIARKALHKNIALKEKVIMYTGTLVERYGVIDLLDAFSKIDAPAWRLVIYGDGPASAKIKEMAKEDRRVDFRGVVAHDIILEEQMKVSILVNPRRNNEEYTKYSFPSKIMEYMTSGTPVVAYPLDGMPREYLEYFYNVPETDDGLYLTIKKVILLSNEERRAFGERAKTFVLENKNPKRQCEKILKLIKECVHE